MESLAHLGRHATVPYTLIKVTPSHLKLLNRCIPSDQHKAPTRTLMIGGEALVPSDVLFWQRRFPTIKIVNHFGPTEATVGCCVFNIQLPVTGLHSIPIGRPIANTRIYILDGDGVPVPIGVAGELYIGGAGKCSARVFEPAGIDGGAVCEGSVCRRGRSADVQDGGSRQVVRGWDD